MSERAGHHPHRLPLAGGMPPMDLAEEARWRESFRDALFGLLATAGDRRDGRSITATAAEALREWLVEAPVQLAWRQRDLKHGGTQWEEGGICDDLDLAARPLTPPELAVALSAVDDLPPVSTAELRPWFAPDVTTWRLVLARRPADDVEEHLVLQLPASADPEAIVRRAWFAGWRQGALELLTTLQVLRAAAPQPADLTSEALPAPTPAAIAAAAAVDAWPRTRRALPRLAAWAWQLAHAVHDAGGLSPGHPGARDLAAALRRHARGAPGGRAVRLCAAAFDLYPGGDTHPALRPWRAELESLHGGTSAAAWLWVTATGAVAAWPGSAGPPAPTADLDELWAWLARRGGPALAVALAAAGGDLSPHRAAGWFALTVLPLLTADRSPRRWRRRAAWLTIAAGAVRPHVDGAPADAPEPAEAHPDAVLELVTTYAHDALGLPHRLDLVPWLSRPGAAAAAHRRHSLDALLLGHLLLDVAHASDPARVTAELRRAHLLAALLHDAGALIIDRLSDAPAFPDGSPLPAPVGADLADRLRSARHALLDRCLADLRGAGIVAAGTSRAEPHGVVGAWVLLHLGLDAGLGPTELHHAATAVLLHGDALAPLDGEPVACLLALTDQLLEWEPSDVTRCRRAERVTLDGLTVAVRGAKLLPSLGPTPALVVRLHARQRSGVPAWQTWLAVGQQLARVRAAPAVRVLAPPDPDLAERDLTTAKLLDLVAWSPPAHLRALALDLRSWLADPDRFGVVELGEVSGERLDAHPLRHGADVRAAFADLSAALAAIQPPRRVGV